MKSIEIDKGIVRPQEKLHHRTKYPFKSMAIGDSVFVCNEEDPGGRRLRLAAYSYARKNGEFRWVFAESVRKSVIGWRVWRVVGLGTTVPSPDATPVQDNEDPTDELRPNGKKKGRLDLEVDEWMETSVVGPLLEMFAEKNGQSVEEYVSEFNQEAASQEIVTK